MKSVKKFNVEFYSEALDFIDEIPEIDRAKVLASTKLMETDFDSVYTKLLKSPIRELIVKKYRLLFFIQRDVIKFVSGFVKKSQKTPAQEIQKAEKIYKIVK